MAACHCYAQHGPLGNELYCFVTYRPDRALTGMGEEVASAESDQAGPDADARYRRIYDAHYRAVLAYCLRRGRSADLRAMRDRGSVS